MPGISRASRKKTSRKPHRPRPLSKGEARDELVALRSRIWEETGSVPSSDGLLRRSLLEAFLHFAPASAKEVRGGPIGTLLQGVASDQKAYLRDVLAIVSRLEQ